MKKHAFIEQLDQIGAEWIIVSGDPDDMRGRKKKDGTINELVDNPSGYTYLKRLAPITIYCEDCQQNCIDQVRQIKLIDRGKIIKCSCGKKFNQNCQKT